MQKLMEILDHIEIIVSQALLFVIVSLVFVSAVLRYVGHPVNWTNALASGLFVWLIYIGADRALRRNRHIGMSFLVERLSEKTKNLVEIITTSSIIVFLIIVSCLGMQLVLANTGRVFEEIFFLSYSVVAVAIPIGTTLMTLTLLSQIALKIKNLRRR
ncbi:TRAP transporter small permease [Atrimonas thermophila]|jgi:TRAP-type C4-dicarboxylate transport system permease small subunit|uniref:TRAP transporter small permease n=1 Tax=Atrimonas thermophila TaxID=3064161 RepID=UPI00399D1E1A